MKILCITSDKYRHLVKGFADHFNANWNDRQEVLVLGYKKPKEVLPDNFEFKSLGIQEGFGANWTNGLIPFFKFFSEDHFLLMLEDYWLNKPVSELQIAYLALKFRDPQVMKIELTDHGMDFGYSGDYEKGLAIRCQNARYRSSLQAAMWRTEYFRKLLVPDRTGWEFELKGERELKDDGAMILACNPAVMQYDNVMVKGKPV